ncbi:type II toxin-antitoxin system VapC family toxin [Microlunatus phosphovorus]|uniref:type II toxin-antitoxin system VapC family toxin n=1 Tax=Microlunatus phosphovorus TaxID=29405 RepID=UPI00059FC7B1|nr:type II toxin-antitoxin system VapC family toxin [Microlunatus phosphovorus]
MIVADASVVIAALVDENRSGAWARSRLLKDKDKTAVPDLLYLEVASAVRRLEQRGELTARRAAAAMEDLMALPLQVARLRTLLPRCWELRHNLTPYDAAYVTLAEFSESPLVTADRRLAAAAGPRCKIELPPHDL